ncbi:hypothetical protein B566_EDAN014504, partial [Ephemera danica]
MFAQKPWYKGFTGYVESVGHQRYVISGEVRVLNDSTIEITELPIGTDFKEYHTDTTVRFVVTMTPQQLQKFEQEGLHKVFKLQTTITNTSMEYHTDTTVRFVVTMMPQQLQKFEQEGLHKVFKLQTTITNTSMRFYTLRLSFYVKRKEYLLGMLRAEARKLSNQARFILEKCDGTLVVENKKKRAMIEELVQRKYDSDPVRTWKSEQLKDDEAEEPRGEGEEEVDEGGPDFDYLLGMKMWSLTLERKQELLKQRDLKLQEVADLEKKTPSNLWLDDLDNLLNVMEVQEAKEADDGSMAGKKGAKLKGPGSKKLMLAAETLPSPKGRRVEPLIDPELRKKIEKAVQLKENKGKKGKKELVPDAEDEFDLMSGEVKPLEQRIGNSPQLVEKKLQEKRKAAKAKFSFDSDDEDMVAEANGDASS